MVKTLSSEHKITERVYMKYQPFGVDSDGTKIEDVRGHVITSILEFVKEVVKRREEESNIDAPPNIITEAGEKAAQDAAEKFVSMLNGAMKDKEYWVTEASLSNPWNSYSTEFFHFAAEFAKEITGEKDFCFKLGLQKLIKPILSVLMRPVPIEHICKLVALEDRFAKGAVKLDVPLSTKNRAIVQIRVSEKYRENCGEYLLACAENTCQVRKGVMVAIPRRIHRMPSVGTRNIKCLANGDEYCEVELTWERTPRHGRNLLLLGVSSSAVLFIGLTFCLENIALTSAISILPLIVGFHLARVQGLFVESENKDKLIEEQQKYLEERFKELENSNIELQETNIELNKRLRQLTETQEKLIHAEKLAALGRFSSYVSHELRNPLTSMKNVLYYLNKKIPQSALAREEPKIIEFLKILDKEVGNSTSIINDILDFTKMRKPTFGKVEIAPLLKDSISQLSVQEGVEILEDIPPHPPTLWIDASQIKLVLVNLMKNACEAMPKGGTLKIAARPNAEYVELKIVDTGQGIRKENISKVFELFFTSKAKGTGLGLSMCKEIVERHGGSITVQSELGAGSTFSVSLPTVDSKHHVGRKTS